MHMSFMTSSELGAPILTLERKEVPWGDLKIGQKVIVFTLFGEAVGVVKEIFEDTGYAESENGSTGFPLFYEELRGWCCASAMNLKAIQKVAINGAGNNSKDS